MLEVVVQETDIFDEENEIFINIPETKLQLEHSLLSIKKWESVWHKPFLGKEKSMEEIRDYIRCMTIPRGYVNPLIYQFMPYETIKQITDYIHDPMTATWFTSVEDNGRIGAQKHSKETVTAEIIYYWMITLQIPVQFEQWHLNQLLTLIRVVNEKNAPEKKVDKKTAAKQRAMLNAQRRAKHKTRG